MGGVREPGGGRGALLPTLRWEQIRAHNLPGDKWLVIERRVYDISKWAQRHPGGSRLIGHHGAEDATVRTWRRRPLELCPGGLGMTGWCWPGEPSSGCWSR